MLATQLTRPQKILGDAYLKVQLDQGVHAVLLMKQVQEVLVLPSSRLTPMPNMPACVLGLMNRRSRVSWVVDLAQMLGIGRLDASPQQHNVAIVRIGQMVLGAAIQQVEGMCWLSAEEIQPPPNHISHGVIAYLRGCVLQNQQVLMVLSAEGILQSPILHNR
jgi:twitching motility protein PilI